MDFKDYGSMLKELQEQHYESDYVESMIHSSHMDISNDEIVRLYNIHCMPPYNYIRPNKPR